MRYLVGEGCRDKYVIAASRGHTIQRSNTNIPLYDDIDYILIDECFEGYNKMGIRERNVELFLATYEITSEESVIRLLTKTIEYALSESIVTTILDSVERLLLGKDTLDFLMMDIESLGYLLQWFFSDVEYVSKLYLRYYKDTPILNKDKRLQHFIYMLPHQA